MQVLSNKIVANFRPETPCKHVSKGKEPLIVCFVKLCMSKAMETFKDFECEKFTRDGRKRGIDRAELAKLGV